MATKTKASRTAPRGETEAKHRARLNRIAAEKRTRSGEDRGTAKGGFTQSDQLPEAQHSEHPESFSDSTVRHAEPPQGKQAGEGHGGFPQGEYDVTKPAKEPAAKAKSTQQAQLDQHFEGVEDITELSNNVKKASRLSELNFLASLEAFPVGTIIEHEAPNRWRVRSTSGGGFRYGHGAYAREAIESYILGTAVGSQEEASARAFAQLPASQQNEIRERDRIAAERVGKSPTADFAREEARKIALADKTAKPAALNAVTDGPEKASARDEAGRRAGSQSPNKTKAASKPSSKSKAKRSSKSKK